MPRDRKICFSCRQPGHTIKSCRKNIPSNANAKYPTNINICYRCGSNEHSLKECTDIPTRSKIDLDPKDELPFANCFVCKEMGHLSGQCPKNPKGLYPNGGGCRFCGNNQHYVKDCPSKKSSKYANEYTLDASLTMPFKSSPEPEKKKQKVILFK